MKNEYLNRVYFILLMLCFAIGLHSQALKKAIEAKNPDIYNGGNRTESRSPSTTLSTGCTSSIECGETLSGSWTGDCDSRSRDRSYAKFYEFTIAESTGVVIELNSSVHPYLYLLDSNGNIIGRHDGGYGTISKMAYTLTKPGTYTIEATTKYPQQTGDYTLGLTCYDAVNCTASITCGETLGGSWDEGCYSRIKNGSYAKFYEFTVAEATGVEIELAGSVTPYLLLLDSNDEILQDDIGYFGSNSKITYTLTEPGTYTIEATAYFPARTGDFTVSLTCYDAVNCTASITCGETLSGSWTEGCYSRSRNESCAKYYEFDGVAGNSGAIHLESSVSNYFVLLDPEGNSVTDDSITNGRLNFTMLKSGTYTIETGAYNSGDTGSFTLSLTCSEEPCIFPIECGETISGRLELGCYSFHQEHRVAKYYQFTGAADTAVAITLDCSVDSFIYLFDSDGTILDQSDGDRLIYRLSESGTYTIEVVSPDFLQFGDFTLSLECYDEDCTSQISCGETLNGSWTAGCYSRYMNGSYAKAYEFTGVAGTTLEIKLEGSVSKALYLFDADGKKLNSDSGGSDYPARMLYYVPEAGTYTIEAMSDGVEQTGDFTISMTCFTETCTTTINCGEILTGSWSNACFSPRSGTYAKYYEFSGLQGDTVTIKLESVAVTFLYLLDPRGEMLDYSGSAEFGGNSRIKYTLTETGIYTLDATYFDFGNNNDFTISLACSSPQIALSRSGINIGAVDTTSSSETFWITNSGKGELNWTAESDRTWLTCTPAAGTGEEEVSITVVPTGLSAGTYTGTISVADPNVSNSPQTVLVTLTVHEPGQTSSPFGEYL
ncbi:MAG: hypothetical protein GY757_04740, partial [bacterium]|nr:hypothetical protein [bacterium]